MLLCATWAQAVTIDDINFSTLPGDKFEIKLSFDGTPPAAKSYVINSPARIVLDFPDTDSALKEKKFALASENGQNAVVLSAGGTTRLIVNLREPVGFDTRTEGNILVLAVDGPSAGAVATAGAADTGSVRSQYAQVSNKTDSGSGNALTGVDFKRGEKGEALISLGLSNPNIPVDVARLGSDVVMSFYRTSLPEHLNRKLDVIDFATPVLTVDSRQDGTTTKVVIAAQGEYDYLAYQADDQYVVSIKKLTREELEEKKSQFEFVGEKLSLNFQDIEVRSVLQLIADFTELNLVASDTVTGNITLRLENVPWDQALEIVLKAKGLDKRQEGNVLLVAPAVEIAEQERLQVEANKQLIELAPLVTDFVRVRYADARELFDLFDVEEGGGGGGGGDENATSSILSERGTAIVDERTNTIILTDVQEKIDEFRRLVKEIDIPIRQVEIEARIVEASTDFRKELGVRWGISGIRRPGDDIFSFVGTRQGQKRDGVIDAFTLEDNEIEIDPATGAITIEEENDLTLAETLAVDLGVASPSGSIALGLLKDNTFIDLELSALENDGFGEIISQPKVLTGDKQQATIKAGTEIPYQTGTSSGETEIEFREAVLKLDVTPQITPDNRIIMNLVINQDSIGQIVPTAQGGSEPTIDVTEVITQALVGDGQTLVLGGIFQMEEVKGVEKVPVLGDIPYIGKMFRNRISSHSK
ncbi:MAG TPA: type IV pilus secretin PilQ, partial [Porticoccaceae bacterium]|nr:type IV pilus secretin PilQ [Porticoccaceae bacterium]